MLPAIGSISILADQGRSGVVVDARPLGQPDDGRQLVALRVKSTDDGKSGSGGGFGRASSFVSSANSASSDGLRRYNETGGQVQADGNPVSAKRIDQLSAAERADLAKLQQRDQQVRQEEKAHAAVAGDLAGPISYTYQRGPDGRQYAVGGSVSVGAQTTSGDPAEAARLSGRMAAAANAATSPSAQDLATARLAYDFGSQRETRQNGPNKAAGLDLML